MPRVEDAIPKDGFFPKYLEYARSITDAPEIYHVGAALAAFATLTSGKARLEFNTPNGAQASYPLHMWLLLLGRSGDRKSSACTRVIDVFRPFIPETGPTGGSPEAFYTWISDHPTCMFFFTEMATLFGLQQASYWQQGATFFNEIYDGKDFNHTLMGEKGKKGKKLLEIRIKVPRVTMLGCATPSLLDATTRDTDWTGGMIGRMLPFYAEREEGKLNPWPDLKIAQTEEKLREGLYGVASATAGGAAIGLTREAMRVYEDWMAHLDSTVKDYPERMQALITRLPLHILRVAGLYALSTMYADVDGDLMRRAIILGDISKQTVLQLGEILTPDRVARLVKILRQLLFKSPNYTATVKDLLRNLNVSWKTLEPACKSMGEAGELAVVMDTATRRKWLKLLDIPTGVRPGVVAADEDSAYL